MRAPLALGDLVNRVGMEIGRSGKSRLKKLRAGEPKPNAPFGLGSFRDSSKDCDFSACTKWRATADEDGHLLLRGAPMIPQPAPRSYRQNCDVLPSCTTHR